MAKALVWTVLVVAAAAAVMARGAHAAPTLDECNAQKEAWVTKFYTPLLAPTMACFNATADAAHIGHTVRCGYQPCIKAIQTANDQLALFHGPCAAVGGYEAPGTQVVFLEVYNGMSTLCSACIIAFEQYRTVNQSWHDAGCEAKLGTAAACSDHCVALARDLRVRWNIMIGDGLCKAYNPGTYGCTGTQASPERSATCTHGRVRGRAVTVARLIQAAVARWAA